MSHKLVGTNTDGRPAGRGVAAKLSRSKLWALSLQSRRKLKSKIELVSWCRADGDSVLPWLIEYMQLVFFLALSKALAQTI